MNSTPMTGTVTRAVKGGFVVDIGVRGFLPASLVSAEPSGSTKDLVGSQIEALITDADRQKDRVVLSVRDLERRVYADPSRVHPIGHEGKYYRVPGIHVNEPTAQRVPVLFQAGTSEDGRSFAARNARHVQMPRAFGIFFR